MKILFCLIFLLIISWRLDGYQPLLITSSSTYLRKSWLGRRNNAILAIQNPWKAFRFAENSTAIQWLVQNPLFRQVSQIYSFFWWFPRRNLPFDSPTKLFRNSTSQFLAYRQIPRNLPPIRYIATGLPDNFFCYGMYGNTLPYGNWDPAGFSQVPLEIVRRFRESEIKHGRLAMLATVGCLVQETWHPLYSSIGGMAITHMQQLQSLSINQNLVVKLIGLLSNKDLFITPFDDYHLLVFSLALIESYLYLKNWNRWRRNEYEHQFQSNLGIGNLRKEYEEGNYGFDPLKLMPEDPEDKKWIIEAELNHGRLAMIAFIGILGQEYLVGVPASQILRYFIQGKLDQFFLLPEFPHLQPIIDMINQILQNIAEEASF